VLLCGHSLDIYFDWALDNNFLDDFFDHFLDNLNRSINNDLFNHLNCLDGLHGFNYFNCFDYFNWSDDFNWSVDVNFFDDLLDDLYGLFDFPNDLFDNFPNDLDRLFDFSDNFLHDIDVFDDFIRNWNLLDYFLDDFLNDLFLHGHLHNNLLHNLPDNLAIHRHLNNNLLLHNPVHNPIDWHLPHHLNLPYNFLLNHPIHNPIHYPIDGHLLNHFDFLHRGLSVDVHDFGLGVNELFDDVVFEDVFGDDLLDYYWVRGHFLLDYAGHLHDLLDDPVDVLDLWDNFLHNYVYLVGGIGSGHGIGAACLLLVLMVSKGLALHPAGGCPFRPFNYSCF
jgi:hypothetical protein